MRQILVGAVVAAILASSCTTYSNGPTPAPGVPARCVPLVAAFEEAKAGLATHPTERASAAVARAQDKLSSSGCLRS